MNSRKIFITGTARGGTEMVGKMLSANKDIHVANNLLLEILRLYRNVLLNKFNKTKYPFNATSKLPLQDYYFSKESIKTLDLINNSSFELKLPKSLWRKHLNITKKRWSMANMDLIKNLDKVYNPNFIKLINNCFELIASTRKLENKKIIGILDTWVIEMFLPLAKKFRDSKFIIIIRDPRASIASHTKKKKQSTIANSLSFIKSWRKNIAFTIYYKSLKIFRNRLHVMKHEDLVSNPKKVCKDLCKFLNVKFEKLMLDTRSYTDPSTGKIWIGNSSFEKNTFGFSKSRTVRWKKKLSNTEIKAIEFIAYHELKLLKYKPYKKNNFLELKKGLSNLIDDDKTKRKWRTGIKVSEFNYGAEFFRNNLYDVNSVAKDKDLLRRLFLFKEVYKKINKNIIIK